MRGAEKTKKRKANPTGSLVEPRKANTGVLRCLPVDLAQTVLVSGHFGLWKRYCGLHVPMLWELRGTPKSGQKHVYQVTMTSIFLNPFQGWRTFRLVFSDHSRGS